MHLEAHHVNLPVSDVLQEPVRRRMPRALQPSEAADDRCSAAVERLAAERKTVGERRSPDAHEPPGPPGPR